MKNKYLIISLSLLACLFIYLFYRTEKTVITQLFISLVTFSEFSEMRRTITAALPLNKFIIYSLPEGLWVFCISLTSQSLFVKIRAREFNLFFIPLLISIGLELLQLSGIARGRFDVMDIGVSVFFWAIAMYALGDKPSRQNILEPFTKRSFICAASYGIVYLAHVWT